MNIVMAPNFITYDVNLNQKHYAAIQSYRLKIYHKDNKLNDHILSLCATSPHYVLERNIEHIRSIYPRLLFLQKASP